MMEGVDGLHLLILGFSSAKLRDPAAVLRKLRESFPEVEVQLLRADRIAGPEHLSFATRNAVKAFGQEYRRSRSLAMEVLLYVSCQRQISKAIDTLGVTPRTSQIVAAALFRKLEAADNFQKALKNMVRGEMDNGVLEIRTKRKLSELKRVFGIPELEMEASRLQGEEDAEVVKRLVLERSALLALEG